MTNRSTPLDGIEYADWPGFLGMVLARNTELALSEAQFLALSRIYWDHTKSSKTADQVAAVASILSHDQFIKSVTFFADAPGMTARGDKAETRVSELVAAAIQAQSKDKQLVEVELAAKVAERVIDWAKLLGFFIAIPIAILLVTLSILGYSKFEDVQKASDRVDAKILAAQNKIDLTQGKLDTALATAENASSRATQLVEATNKQLASLQTAVASQGDQIGRLNDTVTRIAERFQFTDGSDLSTESREKIIKSGSRFLEYFQKLGYVPKGPIVNVTTKIDDSVANALSYYRPDNNTIFLTTEAAKDDFPVLREYSHRILYSSLGFDALTKTRISLVPIEYGLANYFSASFLDDPKLGRVIAKKYGKEYLYNVDNATKVTKLVVDEVGADIYTLQDAWSGAFWEIRKQKEFGSDAADRILFDAWRRLTDQDNTKIATAFVANVLARARESNGPTGEETVRRIFHDRGMM